MWPARRKSRSTGRRRRASIWRRCRSCASGENIRDRRRRARSSNGSPICAASTRVRRSTASPQSARRPTTIIDKLAIAIRRSHGARAAARRRALRPCARNLYRAERRRLRGAARPLRCRESPHSSPSIRGSRSPSCGRSCWSAGRPDFTRRCHGDLHLRNIVLIDGEPTLFDAVEFSDDDRERRRALRSRLPADGSGGARPARRRQPALQPLSRARGRRGDGGLAALPLFLSLRAAIRAKVEAAGAERLEGAKRDEARALARAISIARSDFFAMLRRGSSPSAGCPASARARSPRALAPRLGRAPGALWLRSDVERKAMFGSRGERASASLGLQRRGHPRRLSAAHRQGPGARCGPGRRSCSTRHSRRLKKREAAAGAAAEVGVAFAGLFLEPRSRRGSSGSPRGAPTRRTPMPTSPAGRRRSRSASQGGRRWTRAEIWVKRPVSRSPGSGMLEDERGGSA